MVKGEGVEIAPEVVVSQGMSDGESSTLDEASFGLTEKGGKEESSGKGRRFVKLFLESMDVSEKGLDEDEADFSWSKHASSSSLDSDFDPKLVTRWTSDGLCLTF